MMIIRDHPDQVAIVDALFGVSDYASTRDQEQLRIHELRLAQFIRRYRPDRRTIFLFVGGMGSNLHRARAPLDPFYDRVWLGPGSFMGEALALRMYRDGKGVHRDLDDRVIVADGLVKIGGLSLYDRFTRWCEANGFNLFVFAWDWRRRLEETVALFTAFLPRFRERVGSAYGVDPLRGFVLLGHSYGGVIVKLLLDEPSQEMDELSLTIACATPFYGFGVVIRRWLQGDPYLNLLGRREVIRTICSLPGCYPLAYLDEPTFRQNEVAMAGDAFPLRSYPSQDADGRVVDPYWPSEGQYPAGTGFDHAELAHGGTIARRVAALPQRRADKLFCVRGVGFDTVGAITWGTSITPRPPLVPGDGIQPAWGTRLAALPVDQCITVASPDHMFFLEHRETQRALAELLPCAVA
jgi:hypothetical protein